MTHDSEGGLPALFVLCLPDVKILPSGITMYFHRKFKQRQLLLPPGGSKGGLLPILVSVVLHGASGFIFGKSLSILSRRKQVAIW